MAAGVVDRVRDRPTEVGLADARVTLTWVEVNDLFNRAANFYRSLALDGRRVCVFAENSAETLVAYQAGVLAGISTVAVSFHLTAEELVYILRDSDTAVVVCGPETVERALEAAAQVSGVRVVGWRSEGVEGVSSWEQALAEASDSEPPRAVRPLPHLHYTSGTTGFPKGTDSPPAMVPGGDDVDDHLRLLLERMLVNPDGGGVFLVVSPLYHVGTLTSSKAIFFGTAMIVQGRFDAEGTLANIDGYGVTTSVMVPTHFQRLLALPDEVKARYDLSTLERVAHTGAICPVDVKRAMIDWFGPVIAEGYGATEAGTTNFITSAEWLAHPGSVGLTIPPFELLVLDDEGNLLGPHQEGRLCYRDTTGRGVVYHNRPDATADATIEPGVFTMGEIGYADDEGYVYITDRASDMVISGGVNVYPAEAERVLIEHPGVLDVACIGVPDADMGEQLKALVIPADPADPPNADELITYCRARLAGFKCPRSVDLVGDIGRNAMGKVNRKRLRAPYWERSSN
ncbi:MAG: AMP-binding protein [Acidobacteria bacterium]|nr:AMP-binding protein [Acidobacteriota bacterium]